MGSSTIAGRIADSDREALRLELLTHLGAQRTAFEHHGAPDHAQRIDALRRLEQGMREARHAGRHLRTWMRPVRTRVNWQFPGSRARVLHQPLGVVGIIGSWNYQLLLSLSPLVSALAAGNRAMIKPSQTAPNTGRLIGEMIAEFFHADEVTVFMGAPGTTSLFAGLPFDLLIFTGSGRVGRHIMRAASENLTPVILELGGKSPALVHSHYSLAAAAERILSAKLMNAGQTCVAPDYLLLPAGMEDEFVAHARRIVSNRYPRIVSSPDYTSIVDDAAYARMLELIADARRLGAAVHELNPASEQCGASNRVVPPTLLTHTTEQMRVLQEEIFGPILPIVSYRTLEDAIQYINARPRPLALYYFDQDRARKARVLSATTSGGVTVNDCIYHLPQHNLPFGGVGPSGMGAYHGYDGFVSCSHKKGVLHQSPAAAAILRGLLAPPCGLTARFGARLLISGTRAWRSGRDGSGFRTGANTLSGSRAWVSPWV